MTKLLVLIAAFSCSVFLASGQPKSIHDILDLKWHLADQRMSGVGNHQSLPEHTILSLHPNYTWQATELIEGSKKGSWRESGKNKVILSLSGGTEAELILQEDGKLCMTRTKGLSKTTIYWKR